MFAPSAIAAVVAVIVLLFQKASPESLGYASVNAPKQSSGVRQVPAVTYTELGRGMTLQQPALLETLCMAP